MNTFDEKPKLVSIVLPVYNGARFLNQSIDSCLQQTYRNIELIVVDDRSEDNSVDIVKSYNDDRIKLIRHQINRKLPAALNTGFQYTSGVYLTWTSHDNYYAPTAIAEMVNFLEENPHIHFVFADDYFVDEADQILGVVKRGPIEQLAAVSCLGGGFLYTRSVYEKVGPYNERAFLAEDYDYWLRVSAYFTLAHLGRPLFYYRQHPESLTSRYGGGETIEAAVAVQRQVSGKNLWRNRVLLSQGHLKAASAFYETNRLTSAARNTLSGIALNPKCLLNRRAQFLVAGLLAKAVLPRLIRRWISAQQRRLNCWPPVGWVWFGSLRRLQPVSRVFGLDRGQCIDRYYIESFLGRCAQDIRGSVLEVGNNAYTMRYGGARVTQSDVLHVKEDNPRATIVADLTSSNSIPSNNFDCIILTQTLQFIYDSRAAVRTLHRTLKPGGVLLATMSGISQISRYDMDRWGEYWRFTSLSARRLFEEVFLPADVTVRSYGNVLAANAFLHGLATEELRQEELDYDDADYELLITVRAVKAKENS